MFWQPFFPCHSLDPDFMEYVYVGVRGDAPQILSSASSLFTIMQMSPNLSDSDSSHLPYLSRWLGEFNQIKLNQLTHLLWRYHLTSNPWHPPNNSNEVGAPSQVQDTDRQKLDCSLCQAFQDQEQVHPWVAVTFASVTWIAKLQWRRERVNACLAFHMKDSLLGRTEKGNCWFQVKDSTSLPSHLIQYFPSVPKVTRWTDSLGSVLLASEKISSLLTKHWSFQNRSGIPCHFVFSLLRLRSPGTFPVHGLCYVFGAGIHLSLLAE